MNKNALSFKVVYKPSL